MDGQIASRYGPERFFLAATNLFNTLDETLVDPGAIASADVAQVTPPRKLLAGIKLGF
ncbi:hypothetical protein [Sphingomonas koreensis]